MIRYDFVTWNNNINLNTIAYPLYVYLELTSICNFKCNFCSVGNKKNDYMPLETAYKALDELKKNNIYDVYYTGGEPLMHPQFKEIVEYANRIGIRQTILTNGYFLPKYLNLLPKIECVCVSFHGDEKIFNNLVGGNYFDIIKKNILIAKKVTNVKINYTVVNQNNNLKSMKSVLNFSKTNNIDVSFSKYNNIGIGKSNSCGLDVKKFLINADKLISEGYYFTINDCIASCLASSRYSYLTHGCGAGYCFCSIDSNGNIKICPSSTYFVGNINKNSFKHCWNNKKLKNFRSLKWIPIYCKSCKNLEKCRCGCKVELSDDILKFNDYQVNNMKEEMWNEIEYSKMKVNISLLRKDKKFYLSLSKPPRLYSYDAVKVLKELNSGVLPAELYKQKDFILSLYRDKVLEKAEDVK